MLPTDISTVMRQIVYSKIFYIKFNRYFYFRYDYSKVKIRNMLRKIKIKNIKKGITNIYFQMKNAMAELFERFVIYVESLRLTQ